MLNYVRTRHNTPHYKKQNKNPSPESASELYRPSDSRLSAKLVPTFADRRCYVVSETDPYGRNFGFLDQSYPIMRYNYVFLTKLITEWYNLYNVWVLIICETYYPHGKLWKSKTKDINGHADEITKTITLHCLGLYSLVQSSVIAFLSVNIRSVKVRANVLQFRTKI
jgi:hypothetical protein